MHKLNNPIHIIPFFKGKLLFHLISLLVTCSTMGQDNKFINAYLENDKAYLEIKNEHLDTPMLLVRHDIGHNQVVWSKQGNHILLTIPQIKSSSGVLIPVNYDYRNESNLIGRFPIIEEKSHSNLFYIDVTELLFNSTLKWNLQNLDPILTERSYVRNIHFLKNETIISTVQTIQRDNNQKTDNVNFSFYKLPNLMKPRAFDHRMGFTIEDEYDRINGFAESPRANIMRWRLEKEGDKSKLKNPLKPIVFYFDPTMPEQWKPYVKAGVMEWLPSFEAAGFTNAIEIREFPAKDSLWMLNSVNYSIIRWASQSNIRGGESSSGSTIDIISDHRSGEILKSDIILKSSYQSLSDDYLVRCGPIDERAQHYPFTEELMGKLIQFVAAHEAGHAFGIKDGDFGEFAYPFEMMRDANWLKDMGHTPSIMSYARHNYIVQPEDSIPPNLLIQKVGPTDHYHIKWGYKIFAENEKSNLENLILAQNAAPYFRYQNHYPQAIGPGNTNEVVESNDPIKSTKLGLKNLKRVLELLPKINENQNDYALVDRLHKKTLELWYHQMSHVASLIGGYSIQYKSGSQSGPVYTPIPREVQLEALDFLLDNAFEVPDWLENPSFLNKLQYSKDSDVLMNYQLKLMSELIEPYRMNRLEEQEKLEAYNGITTELLKTIREHLFFNFHWNNTPTDSRKIELQFAYINLLQESILQERNYVYIGLGNTYGFYSSYIKSIYAGELMSLNDAILELKTNINDKNVLGHLNLCLKNIQLNK